MISRIHSTSIERFLSLHINPAQKIN